MLFTATCPPPPNVGFANPNPAATPGTPYHTATYTCLGGYQISGGPATCNPSANFPTWTNLPTCTGKFHWCGISTPVFKNSRMYVSSFFFKVYSQLNADSTNSR